MSDAEPVTTTAEANDPSPGAVDGTAIVLEERIEASPDVVFEFLVDPDKVLRWMGQSVDIDPRPGGTFWLNVTGDDVASGTYLEVVRPSRVVFTWGWIGSTDVPPGSSTVRFDLRADGDATVVRLTHSGLPGGQDDEHVKGWKLHLPQLANAVLTTDG